MRHAIIIRLKYNDGEEFEKRLAMFRTLCLPSLLRQKDQDFDILVLCNEIHKDRIEALSGKIKAIHHDTPINGDKDFKRKGERASVMPFRMDLDYDIQTRLDSDDMVSDEFTKVIRKNATGFKLLAFKPIKFHLPTLKLYYNYMNPEKSMCLSLCNSDLFIYQKGHRQMEKLVRDNGGQVQVMRFGYFCQTIHDDNASTNLKPTDKLIWE